MYWSLENVPWTNLHDLNLDWIVNTMKQTVEQWIAYRIEMNQKYADFTEQINSDFDDFTTQINEWKTQVDSDFADLQQYVQNYFDNLDLNESTRYVINQMIASGEFIQVLNPSIVSSVENWLRTNITPTTPAVDASLSIAGAAADAQITGIDITNLLTAITSETYAQTPSLPWEQGSLNSQTGVETTSTTRIRLATYLRCLDCLCKVTIPSPLEIYIYAFTRPAHETLVSTSGWKTANETIILPAGYYYRFILRNVGEGPITPDAGGDYCTQYFITDSSLTRPYIPADAKTVGDFTKGLENRVLYNTWAATASGEIFAYYNVTAGERYRLYVWDINGASNTSYPRTYVFLQGGDYVEISGDNRTYLDGTVFFDITTPENASYIRCYINKASDAEEVSCVYALTKYTGAELDYVSNQLKGNSKLKMERYNSLTCKIFRKVVCCGDSYTAGYIVDSNGTVHEYNENYAWPHYMETLTGNTYINCGIHGTNCITWQTKPGCLPKAQAAGVAQAYILGLGLNDEAQGTSRYVPVGEVTDIGTNATTYYGGMSKIMRELAIISPQAFIFVNTNPNIAYLDSSSHDATPYNTALRNIVQQYKGTYNVHLIDLAGEYASLYTNASLTNDETSSHFTALGYEQFAEIYAYVLSDYINKNVRLFRDVAFLPFD